MRPQALQHSPFRRPDWRLSRVLNLLQGGPQVRRCSRQDDDWIHRARLFLLCREGCDRDEWKALYSDEPGLHDAWEIYERAPDDGTVSSILQARLLAGQGDAEIAETLDTTPGAVGWYEALFFDVRAHLHQRDWIFCQVLLPTMQRWSPLLTDRSSRRSRVDNGLTTTAFLNSTLKLFAYFGGPLVVDVMLHGFRVGEPVMSLEGLEEWLDRQWTTTIRRRSAEAATLMEIDKRNVIGILRLHARILEFDKKCESRGGSDEIIQHLTEALGTVKWMLGDKVKPKDDDYYQHTAADLDDEEPSRKWSEQEIRSLRLPEPKRRR